MKPMRKYRVPGHIREIKSDEITRGKNVKPVKTFKKMSKFGLITNKVIKNVNYTTI